MSGRRLGFGGQVRAVSRKELTDALRDRRSLMTALLYPILMPLMITLMFWCTSAVSSSSIRRRTPRPRCGDGDVDLVVVIDEEYGDQFRSVEPAVVRLIHDSSQSTSGATIRRVPDPPT